MNKNDKIKVSLIVPVYNVEKYIDRCFDSIANQTYVNIECIFIDDASSDKSHEILKERIRKYEGEINFKIVQHSQNRGLSAARNTGSLSSTGDYIYCLDSDDEIDKNCISLLAQQVAKYPKIDVVQGNTKIIPLNDKNFLDISSKKYPAYSNNKKWIKSRFLTKPLIPITAWNKLIRKDFLLNNNIFFKENIFHEDVHWTFFLAKKVNSIAFVKNFTYFYHLSPKSITQSSETLHKRLESSLEIVKILFCNIDKFLPSAQKQYIFNFLKISFLKLELTDKILFAKYHFFAKQKFYCCLKSLKIVEALIFLIFLLPKKIYSSFLLKKMSGLLIKML
jgi:glycosyltransferase involved in cell wall biosynthesis